MIHLVKFLLEIRVEQLNHPIIGVPQTGENAHENNFAFAAVFGLHLENEEVDDLLGGCWARSLWGFEFGVVVM